MGLQSRPARWWLVVVVVGGVGYQETSAACVRMDASDPRFANATFDLDPRLLNATSGSRNRIRRCDYVSQFPDAGLLASSAAQTEQCAVFCKPGFVGKAGIFTCPRFTAPIVRRGSVLMSGTVPYGVPPVCVPSVGCAAVPAHVVPAHMVAGAECNTLAAGASCRLSCNLSAGYAPNPAAAAMSLACPSINVDPYAAPTVSSSRCYGEAAHTPLLCRLRARAA
eukprot:COSAG01_NODE_18813_length_1051_cov_1.551471_1_plen_223_part_00